MSTIYTVGHSTRTVEEFIGLLKSFGIDLVADIRTVPKSGTIRSSTSTNSQDRWRRPESSTGICPGWADYAGQPKIQSTPDGAVRPSAAMPTT